MTADLLCWEDIRDQIRVIKRARLVDDQSIINALIEISSSLYDLQFMERATDSRGVLHIIDEVLGVVDALSDVLVERFALPAVHMAAAVDGRVCRQRRDGTAALLFWKPLGRLWTAPLVEPASAWAFWAKQTGNARAWDRQLRYESPPKASRVVVDSLATADELVGQDSFEQTVLNLESDGVSRIDFTWRCVLEAECSALRRERAATDYPCALGTESSLWLASPEPMSELPEDDTTRYDPYVGSRWFGYR